MLHQLTPRADAQHQQGGAEGDKCTSEGRPAGLRARHAQLSHGETTSSRPVNRIKNERMRKMSRCRNTLTARPKGGCKGDRANEREQGQQSRITYLERALHFSRSSQTTTTTSYELPPTQSSHRNVARTMLRTSCQLEFRGKRNRENMWLFRDRVVYLSSQLTNSIGDTWGYIDRINCVEAKLTSSSRAYTQQSTTERRVYSPGIARKNWEREGSDGNKATK